MIVESKLETTTRRNFLQRTTLAAMAVPAAAVLSACADGKPQSPEQAAKAAPAPPAAPPKTPRELSDEMDAMHEAGVKAFPASTEGKGNQPMAPRLEGGVKVFDLTAAEIQWEVEPGKRVKAWAYNGQVPGPQIRVRQGDRVRVVLKN